MGSCSGVPCSPEVQPEGIPRKSWAVPPVRGFLGRADARLEFFGSDAAGNVGIKNKALGEGEPGGRKGGGEKELLAWCPRPSRDRERQRLPRLFRVPSWDPKIVWFCLIEAPPGCSLAKSQPGRS